MADACEEMEGVGMLLSNHHVEGTITSPQEEGHIRFGELLMCHAIQQFNLIERHLKDKEN